MRAALFLGLLLAQNPMQCGEEPSAEGAGGGGGGGGEDSGPPPVCDERGDCATCMACSTEGPCAGAVAACDANPSCIGYSDCLTGCNGNAVCGNDCGVLYPDGRSLYESAMRCVICQYCPADCGTPSGCL